MQRSKYDKHHKDECAVCEGSGHDAKSRPEVRQDKDGRHYTQAIGSGCWKCLGTGRWLTT